MKLVLLHSIFVIILLSSVVSSIEGRDPGQTFRNVETAVVRVAMAHGFELATEAKSESLSTFLFEAPGCGQPILVTAVHTMLEEQQLLPIVREGYLVHYNYFDEVWDTPSRFWAFVQRIKIRALAVIGLTPYRASEWMLRVATPVDCASAERMDWRAVWLRNAPRPSMDVHS
jgi:hypothetical protein